jgi:hypothetical protein
MNIGEWLRKKEVKWFNLFLRDLFLIFVIVYLQWKTNFNSKTVFLITGMLVVWVTWQLNDYIKYKKLEKWKQLAG